MIRTHDDPATTHTTTDHCDRYTNLSKRLAEAFEVVFVSIQSVRLPMYAHV